MSNSHRTEKVKLFRRLMKAKQACYICLKRSESKNMFRRLRRGTHC